MLRDAAQNGSDDVVAATASTSTTFAQLVVEKGTLLVRV